MEKVPKKCFSIPSKGLNENWAKSNLSSPMKERAFHEDRVEPPYRF